MEPNVDGVYVPISDYGESGRFSVSTINTNTTFTPPILQHEDSAFGRVQTIQSEEYLNLMLKI